MASAVDFDQVLENLKDISKNAGAILMRYFETDLLNEATKATCADIVTDADLASDKYIREQFTTRFPEFGIITEEGQSIPPKHPGAEELWLCADPLDGTTNFSCNLPHFSVSLALLNKDHKALVGVIYDPNREELFYAIRGRGAFLESKKGTRKLAAREHEDLTKCLIATGFNPGHVSSNDTNLKEIAEILPKVRCLRRLGSACLDMCYVAAKRLDGYWERGPHIWDVAAGWVIAEEAGCVVSHYNGNGFTRESLAKPLISVVVAAPKIHKLLCEGIQKARKENGYPLDD